MAGSKVSALTDGETPQAGDLVHVARSGTDVSIDLADLTTTLAGTGTYISIAGQVITVDPITESDIADLGAYITGITGSPLSDLSDVTITTPATGEVLTWNGSAWINETLAEAGISAVGHTHEGTAIDATAVTDGHVLTADGAGNAAWEAPAGGAEVNDLTAAVTWTDIPIANVPTGTSGVTVALGDHTHAGVYEPADATIIKTADINTLAELNGIVADATLDTSTASRPCDNTFDDAATSRTALGVDTAGTDNSTDVTLAASVTNVLDITGQAISADDPGADRIVFWDDSAGALQHLTVGSNLTITDTTIAAAGGATAVGAYGSVYISTAMVSAPSGTPIKIGTASGATTTNIASGFTHTTPGKLTYTGTDTRKFKITAALSMTHSSSNVTCEFYVAKNGTVETGSRIDRKIGSGSDVGAFALEWVLEMSTSDYVEIFADDDGTGDMSIDYGAINIMETQISGITEISDDTTPELGGNLAGGAYNMTTTGIVTGGTIEATADTAADDNAAIGYTATEGIIVTGQGSTNDVTVKNDADATVISIPTGTTTVAVAGNLELGHATDTTIARSAAGAITVEGSQVLIANTTIFEHVYINAGAMIPFTTAGATAETLTFTTAGDDIMIDTMAFGTAAESGCGFWWTPPEGWDAGTVQVKFHHTIETGTVTGTIKYDIAAQSYANSDAIDQALGTEQSPGAEATVTLKDMQITAKLSTALTVADATAGEPVWFEITRDVATDTFDDDAHLIGVVIEYGVTTKIASAW